VHGLIFFYIQKFADEAAKGNTSWDAVRSSVTTSTNKYLPSGVYPDADAVQLLQSIAQSAGRTLPKILEQFGEFLAPHLVRVAGTHIDPSWRTLDLIENTESIIHAMIRSANPGAAPPVLETVRQSPNELHLVYSSARRLCPLALGLMRGMAKHYGEEISIEEPSCMLRGDPFCSFVVQSQGHETYAARSAVYDTIQFLKPDDSVAQTLAGPPLPLNPDNRSPDRDEPMPATIGGYSVLKIIGQGGMGRVYLARDERLDRDVAIKVLHPSRARDRAARLRFLREGRAAAAVEHPHVMTIHQVGEENDLPFIVMQRLDGCTLTEYRERTGRVPVAEALRIGREAAEGLAAAHKLGLVHRDIKPDNIFLVGPKRRVKIIDFGLARDAAEDGAKLTVDGAVVGTPAYMSPERIGEQEIDARGDVFGLGVILYELLSTRLPFEGKSMVSVLASISRGDPPQLRVIAPDVPEAVCNLVMRMMAHDKKDRPKTAADVADELAALERARK
jgi:tRNA A-37 threonylcarbamoyl transferase component Bud32/predicted hydrocarbon binding protein